MRSAMSTIHLPHVHSVAGVVGDFAVVLYDAPSHTAIAACDAFGVHPLYYRVFPTAVAFASRAEILADGEEYDRQYLAERLAGVTASPDRTPFSDVAALPAAHAARLADGRLAIERYWSAESFVGRDTRSPGALVEEFRERFAAAVGVRLTDARTTWAQLSGGLDSSSIVCMAETVAQRGAVPSALAGTLTIEDAEGTGGDPRHFAQAVVRRFGVRNERLADHDCWHDDGAPPPLTDRPTPAYLVYARDRRLALSVRDAGGTVLLTGYGADHYLGGSAIFLADWVAVGRVSPALREATRWAATGRVSFWKFALHNMLIPVLPPRVTHKMLPEARLPEWIAPTVVRGFELARCSMSHLIDRPAVERRYVADIMGALDRIPDVLALHAVISDIVEERHPFLDRRLVEFSLGLPARLCAQPCARKWILREAMRGILPEVVRTRPGKGSVDPMLSRSLSRYHEHIRTLVARSMLAELGLLNPTILLRAVARAVHGADHLRVAVARTLAVESWLQARSGRWIAAGRTDRSTRTMQYA